MRFCLTDPCDVSSRIRAFIGHANSPHSTVYTHTETPFRFTLQLKLLTNNTFSNEIRFSSLKHKKKLNIIRNFRDIRKMS